MDGPQVKVLAHGLKASLCGRQIRRLDVAPGRWQANMMLWNSVGQRFVEIESIGPWLKLDLSHGQTWLCQLLRQSRWHLSRKTIEDSFIPRRPPLLDLLLEGDHRLALRGRPIFWITSTLAAWAHPSLQSMGPDPLEACFSRDVFFTRLRQLSSRSVASALLESSLVAGMSNRLKCEILYAAAMAPSLRVQNMEDAQRMDLVLAVETVFRRSLEHFQQRRPQEHQVWDRAGEPCMRCKSPISVDRCGGDGRWTWYCPLCQRLDRQPMLFEL